MKKILMTIILAILIVLLLGCKMFNVNEWTTPQDIEFTQLISEYDTPKKICQYMQNFEWNISIHTYSPYEMYLANLENWNDTGDCDDFAAFGMYVANLHGYTTYRIQFWCKTWWNNIPVLLPHVMTVYVENDKYTYSSNSHYFPLYTDSFEAIIDHYEKWEITIRSIISWKVYDFEGNLIERG